MGMTSTFAQILSNQTLKSKQSPPLATTVSLRQVFELLNCTVKQQPRVSDEDTQILPNP